MKPLFPRAAPGGDDLPLDVAQINADDALIEALRQEPLFAEPADAPIRWLPAVDDRTADPTTATPAIDADHTATDAIDGQDVPDDPDALEDLLGTPGAPAGLRDPSTAAADAQVAALLQAWRAEIESVPLPPPVDTQIAAAVVRSAPARRHSVRPMIAVAASIACLLLGSTAIGARSASPDDTLLWPVAELLWADRVEEVNASIEVEKGIEEAVRNLDAGHPEAAEEALEQVTDMLDKVDPEERADLRSELDRVQSQLDSSRAATTAGTTVESGSAAPGTTGAPGVGTMAPGAPSTTSPTRSSAAAPSTTAPAAQPTAGEPELPPAASSDEQPPETPVDPLPTDNPDPSGSADPSTPGESPAGSPTGSAPVTTDVPTTTAPVTTPVGQEPPGTEPPSLPPGLGQPSPDPSGPEPSGVEPSGAESTDSSPAGVDLPAEPAAG